MYQRSTKSIKERIWRTLRSRKEGSTFTVHAVAGVLQRRDEDLRRVSKSVNWELCKMAKLGLIDRVSKGKYELPPEFFIWGMNHKFKASSPKPKARPPKKKQPIRKKAIARVRALTNERIDVIENLLNAMAEAEPELRRLMEQDKTIQKLAGGVK